MGGLIPSWNGFVDNINSVCRPAQMGPLWMHAEQISGMPMGPRIWKENPPLSSFPPCIAVNCAAAQSSHLGELLLRKLREFCHLHGKNISEKAVLYDAAAELAAEQPSFVQEKFLADLEGKHGQDLFRKDWEETKRCDINRFPTIILNKGNVPAIQISGFRSFATLERALLFLIPGLERVRHNADLSAYREFWGSVLPREEFEFTSVSEVQA